jgi:hypothetical protein
MCCSLVDVELDVFELDEQGKLARFLGNDNVVNLHGAILMPMRTANATWYRFLRRFIVPLLPCPPPNVLHSLRSEAR